MRITEDTIFRDNMTEETIKLSVARKLFGTTTVDRKEYVCVGEPEYSRNNNNYFVTAVRIGEEYGNENYVPSYRIDFPIKNGMANDMYDICDFKNGGQIKEHYV